MPTLTPDVLTVAAYTAFAPISWSDNGQAAGRDIDFLRRFAQQQGLTLHARFFPFDRIWERPGQDACDIAAAGIAPLPGRAAPGTVWSQSYFAVQRGLLVRASEPQLRTIADFTQRTIAVTRGSTAEQDVLARKPGSTQVVYTADQQQALADLAAGRIDAYATGDASCHFLIERGDGRFAIADVHPFSPPEEFAFAVRAASELEDSLNRFIARYRQQY